MFVCQGCGFQQERRTKPRKVVTEWKKKFYPNGGVGWQILAEKVFCAACEEAFQRAKLTQRSNVRT